MTGTGDSAIIPDGPSYSADGRYLIYDTVPCGPSGHRIVKIRAGQAWRVTSSRDVPQGASW